MSSELFTSTKERTARRRRPVEYPEGDGKPMAETDPHVLQISLTFLTMRFWFRAEPEAYVGANMFLYYEEGKPKRRVAPDIFVVRGVTKEPRRSFKLWEEKHSPQVVIEMTSRKTKEEDLGKKRAVYSSIGVEEYYLFDPLRHYLNPPLRSYRLVGEGESMLLPVEMLSPPLLEAAEQAMLRTDAEAFRSRSEQLGLDLWALPTHERKRPFVLRFYDPVGKRWVSDPEHTMVKTQSLELAIQETLAAVTMETQARQAAEAENARLRAELERLRANST